MTNKLSEALEVLKNHQRQLDIDGVEVGVSREALEIVLAEHTPTPTMVEAEMSDADISLVLDGRLGTHMLNGLFHELVDTHRNHSSRTGYANLRKLMRALTMVKPDTTTPAPHVMCFTPTHRHKKRGSAYEVIGQGHLQVDGDLDMERVTIYRGEDGRLWARPEYEFNDGRFEAVVATEGSDNVR